MTVERRQPAETLRCDATLAGQRCDLMRDHEGEHRIFTPQGRGQHSWPQSTAVPTREERKALAERDGALVDLAGWMKRAQAAEKALAVKHAEINRLVGEKLDLAHHLREAQDLVERYVRYGGSGDG